jgi:hypothetical protein
MTFRGLKNTLPVRHMVQRQKGPSGSTLDAQKILCLLE